MSRALAWVLSIGGALTALVAIKQAVVGLVDVITLVRSLLQLQPRVVELAEQIAAGLDEQRSWRQYFEDRLITVEQTLTTITQETTP